MTRDADRTRRTILRVALSLFREHGYAKTTMRRIAREAGLSLGAAYHHFDGKQAIVLSYYEQQQAAHEAAAREAMAGARDLRDRLGLALHCGLDVRATDRALMRELAPLVVGPEERTSAFSETTRALRERSIALWREVVDDPTVPDDLRDVLALSLWALQMGVLLYFAHDESPRQRRTRALVDGALDLTAMALGALGTPLFAPFRARLREVLAEAELL
ncbi:MAG TPA: TetR family transcriptional regulator [Sandaracinaceae bacterium LLY-WYZ-13_1]|nr:TetR family transcriptional regulator [Sandaracinaceae bacterium LLY-WYZ-13_1]